MSWFKRTPRTSTMSAKNGGKGIDELTGMLAAINKSQAVIEFTLVDSSGPDPDRGPGHPLVGDHHIRPAGEEEERFPLCVGRLHQPDQLGRVFDLDQPLGRPTQLQGGQGGEFDVFSGFGHAPMLPENGERLC